MIAVADAQALVDLVDVGWVVWEPDIGQEFVRGGTVVEVRDDPVAGLRVFTIVESFHGKTRFSELSSTEIDVRMTQLPNNAVIRGHVRRMQREAGQSSGAVDSWQYRLMTTAMRLLEVIA